MINAKEAYKISILVDVVGTLTERLEKEIISVANKCQRSVYLRYDNETAKAMRDFPIRCGELRGIIERSGYIIKTSHEFDSQYMLVEW